MTYFPPIFPSKQASKTLGQNLALNSGTVEFPLRKVVPPNLPQGFGETATVKDGIRESKTERHPNLGPGDTVMSSQCASRAQRHVFHSYLEMKIDRQSASPQRAEVSRPARQPLKRSLKGLNCPAFLKAATTCTRNSLQGPEILQGPGISNNFARNSPD